VEILHARRRPGRPSAASVSDASQHHEPTPNQGTPDLRGTPSLVGMKDWLNRIGHSVQTQLPTALDVLAGVRLTIAPRLPILIISMSSMLLVPKAREAPAPLLNRFFELLARGPVFRRRLAYIHRLISPIPRRGSVSTSSP
jgi:hypothetical protein